MGRTRCNRKGNLRWRKLRNGQMVNVQISSATPTTLFGEKNINMDLGQFTLTTSFLLVLLGFLFTNKSNKIDSLINNFPRSRFQQFSFSVLEYFGFYLDMLII